MITMILAILFAVIVAIGALVGLVRGLNKSVIRLMTLVLAVAFTFILAGPVTTAVVENIKIEGQLLGDVLLSSLRSTAMVGDILDAAPLMQEAIRVAPAFACAIVVFPVVFLLLCFISWVIYLFVQKPLRKLIFQEGRQQEGEEKPAASIGVRIGKRCAGVGVGIVVGVVIFAMLMTPLYGLLSMLPATDTVDQLLDTMVQQQMLSEADAGTVKDAYAVRDSGFVKALSVVGVAPAGRAYLNNVSKIEADGQVAYLGAEFGTLLDVAQTATEGGLVSALMESNDTNALYDVLSDKVFLNALMQDMFQSKLLRAAAPEVMAIAMETVAHSMNVPATKDVVYQKMMDSVALAIQKADIDYAGIAAYEQVYGSGSGAAGVSAPRRLTTTLRMLTREAYEAEMAKLAQLEKAIAAILNGALAGDNQAFADSVAGCIVQEVKQRVAENGQDAIGAFDGASVQNAIAAIDPAELDAGEADAGQLLEKLTDKDKFETDVATVETIRASVRDSLVDALADDAKAEETAETLANVVADLVGAISAATDENGEIKAEDLDFEKIASAVTELQDSNLKDVGSSILDIVVSGDLGENDMISDVVGAVQEGYDKGEDIGGVINTAGDLLDIGAAMNGNPEENQEALVNSFTSLINNLNEYTIELLPSIFSTDTITSMGVPAEYAAATYSVVETLLTELMKLQGAADYTNEVNAILHLYDLATTGVENFTEEDIPELVTCALQSDAIYNTIISVSGSNPFGIEIPDEATRTQIADAIEEYYETHSDHSSRERALYQAVATLLGLDAEVNLGA